MKLGVVVTHVVFNKLTINEEVHLIAYIPNPIKVYIYSLGYALFNGFINDA